MTNGLTLRLLLLRLGTVAAFAAAAVIEGYLPRNTDTELILNKKTVAAKAH